MKVTFERIPPKWKPGQDPARKARFFYTIAIEPEGKKRFFDHTGKWGTEDMGYSITNKESALDLKTRIEKSINKFFGDQKCIFFCVNLDGQKIPFENYNWNIHKQKTQKEKPLNLGRIVKHFFGWWGRIKIN